MCGIAGVWSLDGATVPTLAPHALPRLAHRGPDGSGVHSGRRGVLGFRRLAIVDVAGGDQPFVLAGGSVALTANGEIYNHAQLRAALRDAPFRSRSDIEVVLHGYVRWGLAVFRRIRGMFAVAIADERVGRLVLARDAVGKKPVYYRVRDGILEWSSELGALLGDERPPIDRRAVNDYLRFGYVPAPLTMFEGVHKLPAGCVLVAENGRIAVQRWAPVLAVGPGPAGRADWAAMVREALLDAVSVRLESEVPLGFLLSGGVDSSAVFALGAQRLGGAAHAITLGFSDGEVDESAIATEVAGRYGATHVLRTVGEADLRPLEAVVAACGEPIATDALLPTDRVFAAVRDAGLTTILAGEGADEVFAGYRKFLPALGAVLGGGQQTRGARVVGRYLEAEEFCFPTLAERRQLLGDAATDDGYEWLDDELGDLDPLSQMLCAEVALRLPDRINARLDRLSMAYGIEARAPFMDPRVVSLALSVPHALRVRGDQRKAVLRDAVREDLPESVLRARKAPFRAPLAWTPTHDLLSDSGVRRAGLVEPKAVAKLRARAAAGDARAAEQAYSLQVLHAWHRGFHRRQAQSPALAG